MRNKLIGSRTKEHFKKTIKNVVDNLGRKIIIYLPDSRSECPNCYFDKISGKGTGIAKSSPGDPYYFITGRCPVCYNKGVITTSRRRCIEGLVIWNPQSNALNNFTFTEAGMEGATKVELKTDPRHLDIIKNSKYVMIDGIKCKLAGPPLLRGLGNKSLLIAVFFTGDKPRVGSGENYCE